MLVRGLLLSFFTLIAFTQAEIVTVTSIDEFTTKSKGLAKVVILITLKGDKELSAETQDQVTLKCADNPDIKCFMFVYEKGTPASIAFKNSFLHPNWVPYVGFLENGNLVAALNEQSALKDHQRVNAGFRKLGGKG